VVTGRALDPLFGAVVEAAEEAVLNSMFTAPTVVGRSGNTSESIHSPGVMALVDGARR
jgi:D-aminopeptidase